jgi:NADPH:quinone reductase
MADITPSDSSTAEAESMRALRFESYGPPSVLQFREIEAPGLQPDEVLVRVLASGVTRIDVGAVSGLLKSKRAA